MKYNVFLQQLRQHVTSYVKVTASKVLEFQQDFILRKEIYFIHE